MAQSIKSKYRANIDAEKSENTELSLKIRQVERIQLPPHENFRSRRVLNQSHNYRRNMFTLWKDSRYSRLVLGMLTAAARRRKLCKTEKSSKDFLFPLEMFICFSRTCEWKKINKEDLSIFKSKKVKFREREQSRDDDRKLFSHNWKWIFQPSIFQDNPIAKIFLNSHCMESGDSLLI